MTDVSSSPACPSSVVLRSLSSRASTASFIGRGEQVDDVVFAAFELGLAEEVEESVVASVAVDQDDLLEAVAGQLVAGLLEDVEHHPAAVSDRPGLVLGLEDLADEIGREDDRVLSAAARNETSPQSMRSVPRGGEARVSPGFPAG